MIRFRSIVSITSSFVIVFLQGCSSGSEPEDGDTDSGVERENACGQFGPTPAEICGDGIDQDCDGEDLDCESPELGPAWVDGKMYDANTSEPLEDAISEFTRPLI